MHCDRELLLRSRLQLLQGADHCQLRILRQKEELLLPRRPQGEAVNLRLHQFKGHHLLQLHQGRDLEYLRLQPTLASS
jgi:hypothetical protein